MNPYTLIQMIYPLLLNSVILCESMTVWPSMTRSGILPSLNSIKETVQNASEKAANILKPLKIVNLVPNAITNKIESRNFITGSSLPNQLTNHNEGQGPMGFYDFTHRDGSASSSLANKLLPNSKDLLKKLNVFSRLKGRGASKDSDMATSESSHIAHMMRYPYHMLPPPPSMMSSTPPLSPSPSMRYLSYHYPPFPAYSGLQGSMRRMTTHGVMPPLLPRTPYSFPPSYPYGSHPSYSPYPPASYGSYPTASASSLNPLPVPAYFPLGSMSGTPILDPAFHAALASSLSSRYSPSSYGGSGSSFGGMSPFASGSRDNFYDDFDSYPSFAASLKRYFRPTSSSSNSFNKYSDKFSHNNHKYRGDRDEFGDLIPSKGSSSSSSSSFNNDKYRASPSKNKDSSNHKYTDPKYEIAKYDDYKDTAMKYDPYPIPAEDGRPINGNAGDPMNDGPFSMDDGLDDPRYSKGSISNGPSAEASTSTPKFTKDFGKDFPVKDYKESKPKSNQESNTGDSYVDVYGWRGPSAPVPKDYNEDGSYRHYDNPSHGGSYGTQKDYGSRGNSGNNSNSPQNPPSSSPHHQHNSSKDLEAASSDKSRFY